MGKAAPLVSFQRRLVSGSARRWMKYYEGRSLVGLRCCEAPSQHTQATLVPPTAPCPAQGSSCHLSATCPTQVTHASVSCMQMRGLYAVPCCHA